jgi:hypothetical protein
MAPIAGTSQFATATTSTILKTVTCGTRMVTTSMSTSSRFRSKTPIAAARTIGVPAMIPATCTGRDAAMRRCRTEITSTIWWTVACIIRTVTIATITVRSGVPDVGAVTETGAQHCAACDNFALIVEGFESVGSMLPVGRERDVVRVLVLVL